MGKDKDKRKSVKGGEEGIGEVQAGNNFLIAPSEAVTKLDTSKCRFAKLDTVLYL